MDTLRESRLNVLLTEDRPYAPARWVNQLQRLLEPQGVAAYIAKSGSEAIDYAKRHEIHAAIIDLGTPSSAGDLWSSRMNWGPGQAQGHDGRPAAGIRLIELLRRLPNRPPIVVVRGRMYSRRQVDQLLREALKLGVFSVVNAPVNLEQILGVFRRLVDRQYRGHWPQRQRSGVQASNKDQRQETRPATN